MLDIKTWQQRAAELTESPSAPQAYALLQAEIDELRAALVSASTSGKAGETDLHGAVPNPKLIDDNGQQWRFGLRNYDSGGDIHWTTNNQITHGWLGSAKDMVLVSDTQSNKFYAKSLSSTCIRPVFRAALVSASAMPSAASVPEGCNAPIGYITQKALDELKAQPNDNPLSVWPVDASANRARWRANIPVYAADPAPQGARPAMGTGSLKLVAYTDGEGMLWQPHEEKNVRSGVRIPLYDIRPTASGAGDEMLFSYECMQPGTDGNGWVEFYSRSKPEPQIGVRNIRAWVNAPTA